MSRLTISTAKKNIGKYIDSYKRMFGYYPMKIIEIEGVPYLRDRIGVGMPIPEEETDFNCQEYDYIFTMEESE